MTAPPPLQIAAFFDKRPGHKKQTLGILEALQRITPVTIHAVDIEPRKIGPDILDWLKFFLLPRQGKSRWDHLKGCDLIIGTGSRTHIPMLSCKKEMNIPVITCMSPSALLIRRFDLCFIPLHDGIEEREGIVLTDGPPNQNRAKGGQKMYRGLILAGGIDEKSHSWEDDMIAESISCIVEREPEIQWTLSTSPRTPDQTVNSLGNIAEKFGNCHFTPFEETWPGWVESQYDLSGTVWVTADSMSMVYEALSAGCNVGLIPVRWKKHNNKFIRSEQNLLANGYVTSYEQWLKGKGMAHSTVPLNEADRCAKHILQRWWPDRLQ